MKKFIILFFVTLLFVTNIYAYPKALEDNIVDSIVTEDGKVAVAIVVPGKPPENYRAPIAYPTRTSVILSSVPAFDWSFGCSATSAAMAAGFYDNMGYPNMYDGPTNGGLMPQDNTVWPDWVDTCGATRHQCPLSATHQGLDGRTTRGHVDDYWICYGEEGPDPWEGNWPEHTYGECTADYMKTNQWVRPADTINTDGGTTFWKWTDGSPMTYTDIENEGLDDADGSYGFKLFCESRGYTVNDGYGQLIYGFDGNTKGFTYNEYKNEIDNGRPVLIHITNHTMLGYGYDDGGGTNTVYVHDTWDHNQHQMTWGGAYSGSIHYGVTTLELAPTDINVWTGDYNNYWGNADNWSLGHVPDATEDVEITDANNPCIADYSTKNCKSLTIYPGATVQIEDENIVVQEDAIIHGNLDINNTNGNLYVYDDITWESGSTCDMTESSVIYVYGTWEFKDGAEVQLDEGFVDFQGGSASFIRTKDDDSYFYRVKNNKSGSILAHSGSSTHSLHISANLYIYSGCQLKSYSDEDILIDGFINNMSGSILLDYGTLKYEGLSTTSYFESGDYINNLIINSSEKKTFQGEVEVKHDLVIDSGTLELKDNLEVDNHITINSGILDPDNCSITVAGNWLNNVGSTGFYESTSRVIFAGSDHQYIYSNETFDTLEVDCGAAVRVIDVNHTVTCNSYDWTSGGIDILSGTFTALDLENDGIYGGYWLNTDGEINLHQDGSSYIDLNGDLHIFGGTMNVYGGSLKSYWPYLQDASITMSGGVLDFKDNGIYVCVSGTHTLTEDITGGTIRTSKGFTGNRTDFNPNGGTIELYGSTDADLSMGDGSNLYNVEINKTSKENINKNTKKPEYEIVQNRDGSITRYAKSNTATAGSELDINGDVTIESGILDCNDSTMYVSGSWTNNVGDAGFVEAEGTVVFDGSLSKNITTNETFYDLNIDKATYAGVQTGTGNNSGVDITVLNDLNIQEGSFELNNPTNLTIGCDLIIFSGGVLDADDTGTINISVADDWFDYTDSGGFESGASSVVTFNSTQSGMIQSVRENEPFNDIIINSAATYVRPSSTGPTVTCNNMDIDSGTLNIASYKVVVNEELDISDKLQMTSADDSLHVRDIFWQSGSFDNITDGKIFVSGDWNFNLGTNANLGTGNTVYMQGNGATELLCNEPDAAFGNLIMDKPAGPSADTYIDASTTDTLRVNSDLIVNAGNQFHASGSSAIIDSVLDIQDTAEMDLSTGSTIINNSDFTLNGELDVGNGEVLIHGQFELASTGKLIIDGGSFVSDAAYAKNKALQYMRGTLKMEDGLFEITNNHISILSSFVDSISGGIIRTGGSFVASMSGTFQPSGGTVELATNSTGYYINCINGNYLHNLKINGSEGIFLYNDIIIKNNLLIEQGNLHSDSNVMYVGGDWTNNVGDSGFSEVNGTVVFDGTSTGDLTTDETFYNLKLDKTYPSFNGFELTSGVTVNVLNNLNIEDGTMEMNNSSTLDVNNDINILLGAGLNANSDTGLNIFVGGDWSNNNSDNNTEHGFSHGTSTVTFDGSTDQGISSSCVADTFYNITVDKSAGNLRPNNGTAIFGDLTVSAGSWWDNTPNLTHAVYGDFTVDSGAAWYNTTNNTVVFSGTLDQFVDFDPSTTSGYFYDVIVDKSAAKINEFSDNGEPITLPQTRERAKTVTLNSNCVALASGTLTVDEGTFDLNGYYYRCTGDVIINDGGTMTIDDNAWLEVGGGCALTVNNGGNLELIGSSGNEAKLTHHADYYDVDIESGGAIAAEYAIFEYMSTDGVEIKDGAIIDPSHTFNNCKFRAGEAGGTLLIINNADTISISDAVFPANYWSGTYNVSKTLNHGKLTFANATGDFAGSDYENDSYDRIDWADYLPELEITNAVWSETNTYVCDTIDVDVTVKNLGNADASSAFTVDFYQDQPSAPVAGDYGEEFTFIDSLNMGDSITVSFNNLSSITDTVWTSWFQVDTDNLITESDESNNVYGPNSITWNALPAVSDLNVQYNSNTGEIELTWSYSTIVDSFYIYRDTNPYFTPTTKHASVSGATTTWSETASGTKYFYIVTAKRNDPPPVIMNNRKDLIEKLRK